MVGKGTSGGECYGEYSGAGYVNSCIHSGSNGYTAGDTVWYNYAVATAGTITNSSSTDITGNTTIATESICPKGWTLPSPAQTRSIGSDTGSTTYISNFSPILGGYYNKGLLVNEAVYGMWWGSTAYNSVLRYDLSYHDSSLYTRSSNGGIRTVGFYIRCVSEEKDVSDLTYMQDMTPSILQELCVIVNVLRA